MVGLFFRKFLTHAWSTKLVAFRGRIDGNVESESSVVITGLDKSITA